MQKHLELSLDKMPTDASLSNQLSTISLDSSDSCDISQSSDDERRLPTFAHEVIVIRPEIFYENTDC